MNESKACLKKIKGDLNKWKDILCSWKVRTDTVQMAVLLRAIYGFNIQFSHSVMSNSL